MAVSRAGRMVVEREAARRAVRAAVMETEAATVVPVEAVAEMADEALSV